MAIRVGVDVGGTFTKAIAFDTERQAVVAEAVIPTSHDHVDGAAAGVVDAIGRIAQDVGAERIELVTHSTTQAVNAFLEGDGAVVGLVGMGRRPDLRKARRRTIAPRVELNVDHALATVTEFVDVTDGFDERAADAVVARLRAAGAEAIAVAEAFAPDDPTNERLVADAARRAGLPATTSSELSGLYGLELRSVSAALNASILPIALHTAEVVRHGVAAVGITAPVLVMRGDGGATDLDGFRSAPTRTLYSGPSASVAGAIRTTAVDDAVVVEVGGTSTNVAAVKGGQPLLAYVRVASHATAIRALDVRVVGVAGGSLLRARRGKVHGVGPRSAHIAGLPYACYLTAERFDGAAVELIAPRAQDLADHLVLCLVDGRRVALTNTCAAHVLGVVEAGDYAAGDADAARAAFAVAGAYLRLPGDEVARRMLQASTQAVADVIHAVAREHHLRTPVLVAVGGGAGGLGRAVARAMGLAVVVPDRAEVISAVGDALSLVRAERERTFARITPTDVRDLIADVEDEAVRAGAFEESLDIRVTQNAQRGAVRVTATGAVALASGALPGRAPATAEEAGRAAHRRGFATVAPAGSHWVAVDGGRVAMLDRYADVVIDVTGEALVAPNDDQIADAVRRHTRRSGPVASPPSAWVVTGRRLVELDTTDAAGHAAHVAALAVDDRPLLIIGRS